MLGRGGVPFDADGPLTPSERVLGSALWRLPVLFVTVPYPPTTNNAYMNVRKRRVKTQAARSYGETVGALTQAAVLRIGSVPQPPYAVTIRIWVPDARRRDLANCEKLAIDALFQAIGQDDRDIVWLLMTRAGVDRVNPRMEIGVGRCGRWSDD